MSTTANLTPAAQAALALGALGVVFGDIGTSPLYTMKECLAHLPAGIEPTAGVLGILSLILWALVLVVCIKYLLLVMRADNEGEGGIFALLALIHRRRAESGSRGAGALVFLVLVGAALLYGDGVITPAISVLGAAEGLGAVSPKLERLVVPVTCVILGVLFWFQHKGTMRIGRVFGPVMLVWFVVLGGLGLWHIAHVPSVLQAVNPLHAAALLAHAPFHVAGLLGAVVLAFTGAEALYADMGHFGRQAIRRGWYGVAFPGLMLNYFGQGAYVLGHPAEFASNLGQPDALAAGAAAVSNPFFALATDGAPRVLLTVLGFLAAIIASQALISGCYSLTRQAMQLGYFPRLRVQHTHAEYSGQIYLPLVNGLLAAGSILTVMLFHTTSALSAAYGIAVTGTMAITTIAYFFATRPARGRALVLSAAMCGALLVLDLVFFGANLVKILEGGWFPLAIGGGVLAVMHTWKEGRQEVFRRVYRNNVTEAELVKIAQSTRIVRVPGAVVFMAGSPEGTPVALLHHLKSNRALHGTALILTVVVHEVPVVDEAGRLELRSLGAGISRAVAHYGYMEFPDVAELMGRIAAQGVAIDPHEATYVFNHEMVIAGGDSSLRNWQKRLYGFLCRNARPAKDHYRIPPAQIIEIGLPVHL